MHIAHCDNISLMCVDTCGQKRTFLALSLCLPIPKCDSWILLSSSCLSCCGTIGFAALNISRAEWVISSLNVRKSLMPHLAILLVLCLLVAALQDSQPLLHSEPLQLLLWHEQLRYTVSIFTTKPFSSRSSLHSLRTAQLRASAMWSFLPGRQVTLRLCLYNLSSIFWSLRIAWCNSFLKILLACGLNLNVFCFVFFFIMVLIEFLTSIDNGKQLFFFLSVSTCTDSQ